MSASTHLDDDLLLDLVNQLLPAAARHEALSHLKVCATCADRLREAGASHEIALGRAELALAARPTGAGLRPERAMRHGRRIPRRGGQGAWIRPALAVAALLLVVLAGDRLLKNSGNRGVSEPAMAWLPAPEPTVVQRDSMATAVDPRFAQGLSAYRDRDAKTARRLLASARATGVEENVRRIYLGSAELQLGDARAALRALKPVDLAQVPEPWRSEAIWCLSLASAGVGERAAADSLLHLLAVQPGEIGDRARRALNDAKSARMPR